VHDCLFGCRGRARRLVTIQGGIPLDGAHLVQASPHFFGHLSQETVFLTAKTLNSYEPGAVVTWNVKVNALGRSNVGNGVMYIGLTTLGVDTGSDWGSDDSNNAAYYLTSQGNLFNGAMLVSDSYNAQFKEGDVVSVRLDGDAVYFAINGKDVEASIKPITGSLRLSGDNACPPPPPPHHHHHHHQCVVR